MLPDVEAYFKACELDEKLVKEAQDKVLAEFRADHGLVWGNRTYDNFRYAMQRVANDVADDNEVRAWEKLTQSDDRVVSYIARTHFSYKQQALEVLRILPATRAQLEELAVEKDWCNDWDRFMHHAEQNGIIEPENDAMKSQAVGNLVDWFENYISSNTRHKRKMLMLVQLVVQEALDNQKASDTVTEATEVEAS